MATHFVGYRTNPPDRIVGGKGIYYDYILAGNGLFIESENEHLSARIRVAPAEVRGLEPLEEKVVLKHGKIARSLYDLGFSTFCIPPIVERYVAVTWTGLGYHLAHPGQEGSGGGVGYTIPDNRVLDIHSHGEALGAFFSGTDDNDERGFQLYMVVGNILSAPQYQLRVGVYGYYKELEFEEVFAGWNTTSITRSQKIGAVGMSSSSDAAARAGTLRKGLRDFYHRLLG
jgi:hypothetical protein